MSETVPDPRDTWAVQPERPFHVDVWGPVRVGLGIVTLLLYLVWAQS